jgi:hypothetical protein
MTPNHIRIIYLTTQMQSMCKYLSTSLRIHIIIYNIVFMYHRHQIASGNGNVRYIVERKQ